MKLTAKIKTRTALITFLIMFGTLFFGFEARAGWATDILSGLLSIFIWGLGLILMLVIKGLIIIASYQHFIDSQAVILGWGIVRDFCNMFFVVILLVIAFGTILPVAENKYNYKKWLPKLILMAILINFSKTICGLLIDFSQVVMLTFVNAFKDIGGANLTDMLGISKIVTMANDGSASFETIVGAYLLGMIYLIIAIVVVTTMMMILAMRLVMIWIYVVLSPAAYLLSAFPGGQKYASQWWAEFVKNLISGPVLAFFLWLSLASLAGVNNLDSSGAVADTERISQASGMKKTQSTSSVIGTQASTPSALIQYVVAIGMLMGGLMITQQIGGAGGGLAGKGMAKLQKGAAFAGGLALGRAKAVGGVVGRGARNTSLGLASATARGIGNKIGNNKVGNALKGVGDVGMAWRSDLIAKTKKAKYDKRQKFLEKIGMGEKTMSATSDLLKTDAGKEISTATHGVAIGAALGAGAGPVGSVVGGAVGGVVGGAVSFGARKFGDYLNRKSADKATQAAALTAAGDVAGADKANKYSRWYKKAGKMAGSVQAFTSETTQKAAANGSRDIANAKQLVGNMALSPADAERLMSRDSSPSTFYSTAGGQPKKILEQLTSADNPDSAAAIRNLQTYISGLGATGTAGGGSDKEFDTMAGLAKGIAAAQKGGMDISRLGGLIAAINSKSSSAYGSSGHGLQGDTVADLNSKVIAYRNTGQIGEKGSGELAVNTLANNDQNIDGKNIVGIDFGKLREQGINIDGEAEGANVSGAQKVEIANAIIRQINTELSNLKTASMNEEIDQDSFISRNSDLEKAKERLSKPEAMEGISLVNTASKNYGRQEKMTSVYHEEIHKGGVEDEELTEGMAKSLMANQLYGRNPKTKGRHATEIASLAKGMKEKGMGNEDILKEVDKEIKSRVDAEGHNPAARALSKESGQKETESEALEETSRPGKKAAGKTNPEINTEELQKNIDDLSKKFKDFALKSPNLLKVSKGQGLPDAFFLRSLLKKIASSNDRIAKKISTPLEADVLIQNDGKPS